MPEIKLKATTIELGELDARLPELLERLDRGEEVILAREGAEVRRIRTFADSRKRVLGTWSGLLKISDDFDDPLPEFEEYT